MGIKNLYTLIPKIDEVISRESISEQTNFIPRKIVVDSIREEIEEIRHKIKAGVDEIELNNIIANLDEKIILNAKEKNSYNLRPVVNATGIVIHTNLGRSLIGEEVLKQVGKTSTRYSNLEYNIENGTRGSRYSHLEDVVANIVGGEAALVVNNNAAAVLLVLSTVAKNKEVIVSRGELIEIGGAFRIPEVMEQSGSKLVEIGTTNKTHLRDYENAITEETGALLKVHTSNYRIMGFTSSVEAKELNDLKQKYNIPLIEDLGSGVLIDLSKYGISYEPTVIDSINSGVDIVTFSGDKLLGGPQAGIIVGKRKYIEAMKINPLTRAFRVDKFTIAALEATFRYYYDEELAIKNIPTLQMLTMSIEELQDKAIKLKACIEKNVSTVDFKISIEDEFSEVGGGSLPMEKLATKCLVLDPLNMSVASFERNLRAYETPVIGRVYKDRLYLDLRTIRLDDFSIITAAIEYVLRLNKGE
ncbi:MAG: L-seryl-tRNA(Sec) selenium transferase [Tissierellia bacterium]|nr:L-seryl-tRNA(Sec) selenium transferase [Tissierellia bacterium]